MSDQRPPDGPEQEREVVYVERRGAGIAVASLVCGLIGAIIGLIPILGLTALILGVLAIVLGLVGWSRARKGRAGGKGMAITGTILGAVAIVLGIVGIVVVGDALDELGRDLEDITPELEDD